MKARAIATIAVGDQARAWQEAGRLSLELYADRTGAEIIRGELRRHTLTIAGGEFRNNQGEDFADIQLSKMDIMREALEQYQRVLWLDADLLVRPDAPDIFAMVPATHWAGLDEAALAVWKNWRGHVDHVHRHMKLVCEQDGLPVPDSRGIYFNCGVQLAGRAHRLLYEPAARPDNFGWAEQSRINVRLHLHPEIPLYFLPDCFNSMFWFCGENYYRTAYFVHYCGLPYETRLPRMREDWKRWTT